MLAEILCRFGLHDFGEWVSVSHENCQRVCKRDNKHIQVRNHSWTVVDIQTHVIGEGNDKYGFPITDCERLSYEGCRRCGENGGTEREEYRVGGHGGC